MAAVDPDCAPSISKRSCSVHEPLVLTNSPACGIFSEDSSSSGGESVRPLWKRHKQAHYAAKKKSRRRSPSLSPVAPRAASSDASSAGPSSPAGPDASRTAPDARALWPFGSPSVLVPTPAPPPGRPPSPPPRTAKQQRKYEARQRYKATKKVKGEPVRKSDAYKAYRKEKSNSRHARKDALRSNRVVPPMFAEHHPHLEQRVSANIESSLAVASTSWVGHPHDSNYEPSSELARFVRGERDTFPVLHKTAMTAGDLVGTYGFQLVEWDGMQAVARVQTLLRALTSS
jgi:hypothetical protein